MAKNNCFSVEEVRSRITDKRYIFEEFIGEGGMACVYRAKESGTPNIYALKVLKEQYRARSEFVDVFQREAITMRDVQHPNIVRFYKFVVEDQSAYILMDYIQGRPLTKHIQRSRAIDKFFPIDEVVRIMTQIARGISHLHQEGFIHRDVKPGNVLLAEEDGRAYLTDLGIAGAQSTDFTLAGAGTPSYMPYEQQEGGLKVDYTVDIYAFAVMVFEMFTGEKPFRAPSGMLYDEARKILTGLHQSAPVPNITDLRPELPKALNAAFQKAMAKNPAERYRDVIAFAKDIHRILLPMLSEDLHDFERIEAKVIPDAKAIQQARAIKQRTQVLLWGGGALVISILALMVVALIWNNQAARQVAAQASTASAQALTTAPTVTVPPTFTLVNTTTDTSTPTTTATLTDTPSVTDSDTAESTNVAVVAPDSATETLSVSASETNTPRATPTGSATATETPIPSATPLPVALNSGAEALGLPAENATLDDLVLYALREGIMPLPLRMNAEFQDFMVELDWSDLGDATEYGIAFRVKETHDYLLFLVDVAAAEWRIEERLMVQIQDEENALVWENSVTNPVLLSGQLDSALPTYLALISIDENFRVVMDDMVVSVPHDEWSRGGVGLWLDTANPFATGDEANHPDIASIRIVLLGNDAVAAQDATPSVPLPQLNPHDLLFRDVNVLNTAFDVDSVLVCAEFTPLFQRLAAHQRSLNTFFDEAELAQSVSVIIEEGGIINNRCLNLGTEGTLDPNDNVSDFLEFDAALHRFLEDNEP